MDTATIRDIDGFYRQGLRAPLMKGHRGRDAIVDWEHSPGDWVKLRRDKWRGLIADAIGQGRKYLFEYTNASGELALFPLSAAIRFAAGKTCTTPLIDFLCSPWGFALGAHGEGVDDADGRRIVRVKVLTVAKSLAWFDGDQVSESVRPGDHDYIIAPLIRQYDIVGRDEEEQHLDIPHCFFVVICGLSGAVPKRIVYADPMADRRNGVDQAFAKISDPDHPDHHLGINQIRETVARTMKERCPTRFADLTADDFPRIEGYREGGTGVCLALAVAKIAQRPFGALARPVYDLGGFDSTVPIMLALYDRRSNEYSLGYSLGRAMLNLVSVGDQGVSRKYGHSQG